MIDPRSRPGTMKECQSWSLEKFFRFFMYIMLDGKNIVLIISFPLTEYGNRISTYYNCMPLTFMQQWSGVYSHETSDINNSKTDSCHRSRVVGLNENILVHTNYLLLALNSSTSLFKGFMSPAGTNVAVVL